MTEEVDEKAELLRKADRLSEKIHAHYKRMRRHERKARCAYAEIDPLCLTAKEKEANAPAFDKARDLLVSIYTCNTEAQNALAEIEDRLDDLCTVARPALRAHNDAVDAVLSPGPPFFEAEKKLPHGSLARESAISPYELARADVRDAARTEGRARVCLSNIRLVEDLALGAILARWGGGGATNDDNKKEET